MTEAKLPPELIQRKDNEQFIIIQRKQNFSVEEVTEEIELFGVPVKNYRAEFKSSNTLKNRPEFIAVRDEQEFQDFWVRHSALPFDKTQWGIRTDLSLKQDCIHPYLLDNYQKK